MLKAERSAGIRLYAVLAIFVVIAAFVSLILFIPFFNNGDSSIYLTFAKSMWSSGPFHYGFEGPKGGATSPLWAVMLSGAYLWTSDIKGVLLWGKLLSMSFYLASLFLIFLISKTLFKPLKRPLFLLISSVFLIEPMLKYFTAVLFETSLSIFMLLLFIYATLQAESYLNSDESDLRRPLAYGLVSGVLLLVRPDLILVLLATYGWFLFFDLRAAIRKIRAVIVCLISSAILPGGYYLWLGFRGPTKSLIVPTLYARMSINSAMRSSRWAGFFERGFGILGEIFGNPESLPVIAIYGLSILGLFIWHKSGQLERKHAYLFGGLSSFVLLFFAVNFPFSQFERYILSIFPYLIFPVGAGLYFWLVKYGKSRMVQCASILAALACVLAMIGPPLWVEKYASIKGKGSAEDTMFKSLADLINDNSKATDKVLLYEIQAQYYLKIQAYSLDGIVGGEIVPYLKDGRIRDFIKAYHITLIADVYIPPEISQHNLLGELIDQFRGRPIGFTTEIERLRITKIAEGVARKDDAKPAGLYRVETTD